MPQTGPAQVGTGCDRQDGVSLGGIRARLGPVARALVAAPVLTGTATGLGLFAVAPRLLPLRDVGPRTAAAGGASSAWPAAPAGAWAAVAVGSTLIAGTTTWVGILLALRQARRLTTAVEAASEITEPGDEAGEWRSRNLVGMRLPSAAFGLFRPVAVAVNRLVGALEVAYGFRAVLDSFGGLVVVLDELGRVTYVCDAVYELLGWTPEQLRGQALAGFLHAGDLERFLEFADPHGCVGGCGDDRPRLRLRADDGSWRVVEWSASRHPAGRLGSLVLTGRDVTDQVAVERELVHQANHDTLTGLPNRKALLDRAAHLLASATPAHPVAVIMIDLDRFKDVNDSLGHAVGDQLLARVGPRLRSILRPCDTIARIGGDEFAVVLSAAGEDGARLVAERLAEQLVDPFVVDGMELHAEASIGIAVSHRHDRAEAATVEALLREADIAMYRAKGYGTVIARYDSRRDCGQNRSRLELVGELRHAVADGELVLHYQPVVDILEGRLAGVEALVRWQHPERGLLPPGEFLPLAEQTGLIVPLTKVVLSTALSQAATWVRQDWPVQIAVNVSPRLLQHADLPDTIHDMLAEHRVPAQLLRLEITESAILADPEDTLPLLVRLREMGIGLSLDDFGTGYSSMTHLRHLPVDEVKVDRGFVQAMTTAPQDAVIVRAAIGLGHDLGMAVVAEGIEDVETLAEVVAAGCSLAQGYYFSPPLAADALTSWARHRFGRATAPVLPSQRPPGTVSAAAVVDGAAGAPDVPRRLHP
jgi:diguanylate cyclase (GGDEF)-like protein/PAS domain S-box-containing protein